MSCSAASASLCRSALLSTGAVLPSRSFVGRAVIVMATTGALSGGGVALYGKRFSSLPTSLAGLRLHVVTILDGSARPFDRVGQGFFYSRSPASAEVRSSNVMLGSNFQFATCSSELNSRLATTNQRRCFAPAAQGRHADSKSEPPSLWFPAGRAKHVAAPGFMSRSLRHLGNPRRIQVTTPVFPFAFRHNLAMRQPVFFGQLWRKWYIKAMPPG
jgi:hypothetical protein